MSPTKPTNVPLSCRSRRADICILYVWIKIHKPSVLLGWIPHNHSNLFSSTFQHWIVHWREWPKCTDHWVDVKNNPKMMIHTYVEGLKAKCFTPACDIYVPIYRKKYYAFVRWQMGYTHVRPICFNLFPQISTFFCQFLKKIHVNILGFNPPTLEDPFKRIFG